MQLSQAHPLPSSLHQFQQTQQALASVTADHDLKRRYLALLPPQQIIELCLTFDLHVPPYIKSSLWPVDLNAAIGAMQEKEGSRQGTPRQTEERSTTVPLMDSLLSEPENPQEGESLNSKPPAPQEKSPPPTRTNEGTPVPQPQSATSAPATATPSAAPTPTTAPTPVPAPPPPGRPAAYPHQPYGYPHSPYYPHQWGTYPVRFPPFPPGLPFPHFPGPPHPPPGAPSASTPAVPAPPPQAQVPLPVPPPPPPVPPATDISSQDDLPSYEDMIVQVLSTLPDDSEGLVPKDLWTWMASRYPLQSNFRPSAGQALGKAYKKGRLEKSDSGRYRLNPEWTGQSTTRKGTRRPQLQTPSVAPGSGASANSSGQRPPPFTNAPLIRGGSVPAQFTAPNGQPLTMFGYGGFQLQPPPSTSQKTVPTQRNSNAAGKEDASGNGTAPTGDGDAFEAAQHILKALNFGALLTMDGDDANGGEGQADRNPGAGPSGVTNSDVPLSIGAGAGDAINSFDENARAELQAQLALLAVQLGEVLQEPDLEELENGTSQGSGGHQDASEIRQDPQPVHTLGNSQPASHIHQDHDNQNKEASGRGQQAIGEGVEIEEIDMSALSSLPAAVGSGTAAAQSQPPPVSTSATEDVEALPDISLDVGASVDSENMTLEAMEDSDSDADMDEVIV